MPTIRDHLLNQLYQHNLSRRENGYDETSRRDRSTFASDIKLRKDLEISSKSAKRHSSKSSERRHGSHDVEVKKK